MSAQACMNRSPSGARAPFLPDLPCVEAIVVVEIVGAISYGVEYVAMWWSVGQQ
jgi:hypothetical protein